MNGTTPSSDSQQLHQQLPALISALHQLAEQHQGDALVLLELLRSLENLHREICENLFLDSLPDNRQALYALLRDIENTGGWPYIYRRKLEWILQKLPEEMVEELTREPAISPKDLTFDSDG